MTHNISSRFLLKFAMLFFLIAINTAYAGKKNANLAMLLCLAPAGGQFYTARYVPGVIIASTEIALGYYAYKYDQEGDHENRNSMLWWGFFVFGYSLADAYVGAKMYGFDIEADLNKVSLGLKLKW